jgi:ketosteroid isomerase-like protein
MKELDKRTLVESALRAWNRGDLDAFATHVSDDVAWLEISGRPESDSMEAYGRERLRRSLASLFEAWESYRLDVEEIRDAGDRVLAIVREVARGRASGVEIDGRWGYVITVEEGQIIRIEAYRDPALAAQRAGVEA